MGVRAYYTYTCVRSAAVLTLSPTVPVGDMMTDKQMSPKSPCVMFEMSLPVYRGAIVEGALGSV